ncbi:TonB-dependent receptor plug domain-containing protein [Aurantiacibacter hainanensis]|uniref:TonB-dependent receptor plug domain-containing protein n=1 Tax=Aurantiacibacter hainanensis TaxID=3076114 RepID=UPI0030C671E7
MSPGKVGARLRATKGMLAGGASALALMLSAGQATAQDAEDDFAPAGEPAAEQDRQIIYVTGSRIQTDGMQAPVPVTVVGAEELETLSPGALITGVSQLPQFYGNQTPNSGAFFTRAGYGTLNLRGLGVNRTLTLLNGRRVPSTSAFGGVDINLFPEAAIQAVETTTGGASAAYGSDAVAGVVNFILDTDFTGLEVSAQGGITERGDGDNYEISGTFGTSFAGGRGHILVAGEYYDQKGIFTYRDRDWYQGWGTFGSGTAADPYRFVPGTVSANASFDGRVVAPGTAIHQLVFDSTGNVAPYQPGTVNQFPYGIPPARTAGGGHNDDLGAEAPSLYPDLERYSVFAYADFEATDNLTLFAQYLHGRTRIWQYNTPRSSFGGTPTALTIFQDNFFLPDSLRQTMIANNIESFTLRRMGSLEDIGGLYLDDQTTQHIGTVGLEYDFDSGWSVDAFYQYGHSERDWRQFGLRVDRIFAAVDAVDDGTGNPVCRVSLFGDAFPGCEPLNLFGRGNASAAAVDYVTGVEAGQSISTPLFFADDGFASGRTYDYTTSPEKVNLTTFEQHFAEISASGELLELWAGPLAVALGGSYRRDEILQLVQDVTNPASDHESGHPVLCNGEAPGLRGVSTPDCLNTVGIQYSKVSNIKGRSEVWEAFGEVLMPLVDTDGFTANANAAVRWADYSGSGSVWAYKGGLELGFIDEQIRLRGTYSRDVRAGNLSERFDRTGGSAVVDDPRTAAVEAINVTRFSGGNPEVSPEEADTWTVGVVLQPDAIPGLSLSVDYYNIEISGAISQVGNQEVLRRCFEDSAQEFCDLITLTSGTATPGASGDIVLVGDVFVNVAAANVEGLDFEASYNTDLDLLGGDESLSARLFTSWLLERSDTDFNGNVTDVTGQTGATQSSGVYLPYADFKATGGITYRNGGLSGLVQVRHIGGGIQDASLVEGIGIEDNSVDSVTYIDLRLGYEFDLAGTEVEIYGNITNLGDEAPPVTPSYSAFLGYSSQVNTAVYDVLGRRYTLGIRVRM